MTILATMKQALEALEYGSLDRYPNSVADIMCKEACADLRAAIEQIEKAEPVAWFHIQGNYKEPHYRQLDDGELSRGWEQEPLYTFPPDAQAEIERLTKERDSFYMDYRMKCDVETKELRQQLDAERQLRVRQVEELNQLIDHLRQQLAEREGWQLVPKEPTPEMVNASWECAGTTSPDGRGMRKMISIAYHAMLAAAPKPKGDL